MNILSKIVKFKSKACLSLTLGALSSLAMPPFCAVILLFLIFPIMIYLFVNADSNKKAFIYGWLYGLGYFSFGLYWISNAIKDDFPYLVPLAILGIPVILAIYTGLAGFLTKVCSKYLKGFSLVLTFSFAYFTMEFLRGHLFTGFPWNLTGYSWTNYLSMMQGCYYFGIYGFSFLSILCFSMPYIFLTKKYKKAIVLNGLVLCGLVFLGIVGYNRIEANRKVSMFDKNILFVQPSIPIEISNLDSLQVFDDYKLKTRLANKKDVDIIVWGETAIPFDINNYPEYLFSLSRIIPDGAILLTGSIRRDEQGKFYNSILVIDSQGKILESYDKAHLVPFGEYMPFDKYIDLEKIVGFDFLFSKGQGRKTIKIDGIPSFSPLVCYEMVFPNEVYDKHDKPDFIFNVSNDTFYGNSSGPYQHFGMAVAQAIASNLPIVRVGNNGISGIISNVGVVQDFIGLNENATKKIKF